MQRKWEVNTESGKEQEVQKDVPIFSNRDAKFSSGIYAVDKVIFLTKSGTWMLITRYFKVFVSSDEMNQTWSDIDAAIFKQQLLGIHVNRLQWNLAKSDEPCSYTLRQTDKAEIYSPEIVPDDELEAQPTAGKPARLTGTSSPKKS